MSCHTLLQGNHPDTGTETTSLTSPALASRFLTSSASELQMGIQGNGVELAQAVAAPLCPPGRLLYKSCGSSSWFRSCSSSQGRANGISCDGFTLLLSCTVPQKGLQKESLQECIIYSGSFACQTQISFGEILLPHNSTRADPLQDLQGHPPDLPFRPISGV